MINLILAVLFVVAALTAVGAVLEFAEKEDARTEPIRSSDPRVRVRRTGR